MEKLTVNPVRVWLFQKLLGVATAIQNIPARVTPPPFRLMQMGSLFWQSRALYVATRLGLADALGDAQKSTQQLAAELNLHEDHLYRLMRMLAALAIFTETAPRQFRNSRTSAYLRVDNPHNVRAMILFHNSPPMTKPWTDYLEESVRDGSVPFASANGSELFAYMDQHKEFDLLFAQAMDSVENLTGTAYLDDFNWSGFDRIIDVGGSKGSKSIAILNSHPHLKAVVYDRPQIIDTAKIYWQGRVRPEVLARIEFQSGDMLQSIPAAKSRNDLYVLFAIFHGMSDASCTRILINLRAAMGTTQATVLFVDAVAEEMQLDPTIASFDMQMLIGTQGRERTASEWQTLLSGAGFDVTQILPVRTFAKFIVARVA